MNVAFRSAPCWVKCSILAALFAAHCAFALPASAEEYWVEPGASGSGAQGDPIGSIVEALDVAEDGDTIWLESGSYGVLSVSGLHNDLGLVLAAADGATPQFESVVVEDSSGVTLRGLQLVAEGTTLVDLSGERLAVEDCTLMSTEDASGWSAQDWIDRASTGITVSGSENSVRNNKLVNVGYGISVDATSSLIEGNLIENFSRDGLRGLGDYSVFQYNTVKNCYKVDDHHDDGFQSWSVGEDGVGTGEVVGIVLRGNTFINTSDPDQPFQGTLQGIGCFDGTFVDWVVENNVVMTDHWHGITLLGARDCTVVNNTVIDLNDTSPGPPWISVDDHKDGTPPSGCVVQNNLTTALANAASVTEHGNIVVGMAELDDYFTAASEHDLSLIEGAAAIDVGISAGAPAVDRDRIARPQGTGVDVGAYEWHDGSVMPEGGSGGVVGTGGSIGGGASTGGGAGAPGAGGSAGSDTAGGSAGQTGDAAATDAAGVAVDSVRSEPQCVALGCCCCSCLRAAGVAGL